MPQRTSICFLLLPLLALASPAFAQIGPYTATTLEVYVDQADLIVRAQAVVTTPIPGAQSPAPTLTTVLGIRETLKGDPLPSLTFASHDLQLSKPNAEYLYLFRKNPQFQRDSADPATAYPFTFTGIIQLSPVPATEQYSVLSYKGYFTTDLHVLDKAEDILAAVRAEAARNLKSPPDKILSIGLPTLIIGHAGRSGDGSINYLTLPVDDRLQTLAHRMISHTDEIFTADDYSPDLFAKLGPDRVAANIKSSQPFIRAEGISALQPFKSDANIALIKPFLNDPFKVLTRGPGPQQVRNVYTLRTAAYTVLHAWNVPVDKPILEEDLTAQSSPDSQPRPTP